MNAPTIVDGKQCIWLQDFGWHEAKPLAEVKAGDTLVYTGGMTGQVVSVAPSKTGSTISVTVLEKGKQYIGKPRRSSTLVAVREG